MVNSTDNCDEERLRIFTGVFNSEYVKRKRTPFERHLNEEFDDIIGQYFVEIEQLKEVDWLSYTAVFKDEKKANIKDIDLKDEMGEVLKEVTIGGMKYYTTNKINGIIYEKVGSYVNGKACLN